MLLPLPDPHPLSPCHNSSLNQTYNLRLGNHSPQLTYSQWLQQPNDLEEVPMRSMAQHSPRRDVDRSPTIRPILESAPEEMASCSSRLQVLVRYTALACRNAVVQTMHHRLSQWCIRIFNDKKPLFDAIGDGWRRRPFEGWEEVFSEEAVFDWDLRAGRSDLWTFNRDGWFGMLCKRRGMLDEAGVMALAVGEQPG